MKSSQHEVTSDHQLAQKLAHDITSPLTVMQLTLGFIKKKMTEENLSMMETAINQIRELTHGVLNKKLYSHIELNSLVHKMISEKKFEWKEKPCDIEFTQSIKKFNVFLNRSDILRTLSNLLNNAYESLREKRNIFISINENEKYIILCIQDTGCGIPENKIQFVLSGNSFKINGHGIGLSSAYDYMRDIGGDLQIESKENTGTKIKLLFRKSTL